MCAVQFAYVPATGDGLTVRKSADDCGDLVMCNSDCGCAGGQIAATCNFDPCCGRCRQGQIDRGFEVDRPFTDDPFARDSCA